MKKYNVKVELIIEIEGDTARDVRDIIQDRLDYCDLDYYVDSYVKFITVEDQSRDEDC